MTHSLQTEDYHPQQKIDALYRYWMERWAEWRVSGVGRCVKGYPKSSAFVNQRVDNDVGTTVLCDVDEQRKMERIEHCVSVLLAFSNPDAVVVVKAYWGAQSKWKNMNIAQKSELIGIAKQRFYELANVGNTTVKSLLRDGPEFFRGF